MMRLFAGLVACLAWLLVPSVLPAADFESDRFEKSLIAGDLVQPMEMEIGPAGEIYLIELSGLLKRIDPARGSVDVIGQLDVTTQNENGLIGLALDPDFANNGWIFLQYSPPDFPGQHVSRFRIVDGKLDNASENLVFRFQEQREQCCHHAGALEFGPGGDLFIGTGDNTNPFDDSAGFAPLDQREGRSAWDAQRTAGNTKSYNGKVLRIHPEADGTYSIPEGNLFPKDGNVGHPEIYVMGCRNPWRISVDKRTGFLYWGDVGPDAGNAGDRGPRGHDEINQARRAGNFGWPYFIADNQAYPIVDFATQKIDSPMDPNHPLNRSINNTGSVELPPAQPAMVYYPSASTELFPAVDSGGRTACAGPVYHFDPLLESSTKFPATFDNTLFIFEWSRNWVLAAHLDDDSRLTRLVKFLPDMSFMRPIDMQFGPEGSLYVIEYGETWGVNPDAKLVRIDYVSGNRAPIATATATGAIGREPLHVQVSAAGSRDPDGDEMQFQWAVLAPGSTEPHVVADTQDAELVLDTPGVHTIRLVVTDSYGATGTKTMPAVVGNSTPTVAFVTPQDGDFFVPGQPIEYQVFVTDAEDGTNDLDAIDNDESLDLIEATAPMRVQVELKPFVKEADADANQSPGLVLMRKSDCLNCHAPDRALVGPSFLAIADKYRDQPHQVEISVDRVLKGSSGVWGKVGMLPHSQHTLSDIHQMVQYVFSTTAGNANPSAQGFNNQLVAIGDGDRVQIQATYTDLGSGDVPKLSGSAAITLRSRKVQAESADEIQGAQVLNSGNAEASAFVGDISSGAHLAFKNVRLSGLRSATVRVASNGAGGDIEFHVGGVDGPIIGGTTVEVNGHWEQFYEKTFDINAPDQRTDLYVVFRNQEVPGGLMNLDSFRVE